VKRVHAMPFGATWNGNGALFRLWAPSARRVALMLERSGFSIEREMDQAEDGFFQLEEARARPGDRYRYRIDDRLAVPDPASRFQPEDVHGPAELIDPASYDWHDGDWRGRPWEDAAIYELHVGAFTPEGTFAGVERRLDHLIELGVTAIELMPIAAFPGARNWGYDGVLPFAPEAGYGRPEILKQLIDAAHGRGLMVVLDVVYNHFGPEGNYLAGYAPQFFDSSRHTPWGAALNFDRAGSRQVRAFFVDNALYWLTEYNMDGLRLDAVHAMLDATDPDLLEEIAVTARERSGPGRHIHLVVENDRNVARYLVRDGKQRAVLYDAQWNDDFHHAAHVLLIGEAGGYYRDYAHEPMRHLARALTEGFAYQGEPSAYRNGAPRGEDCTGLPPAAFLNFLQNHDQVGNRAFGERLGALAPPDAITAALAVLLMAPQPPLLFMGEEWDAPEPFPFFCDFGTEIAAAVRSGRRREFAGFPLLADVEAQARIPDPTVASTFASAVLDWDRRTLPGHRERLALYRHLLRLRRHEIVPRLVGMRGGAAVLEALGDRHCRIRWRLGDDSRLFLFANLAAEPATVDAGPPSGRILYASQGDLAASITKGRQLPWSVLWTIAAPAR
jgi:maltooligosyltrehalose trehalohydrolase